MTLYQFNHLFEREQELALREAVLLADRECGTETVYLFQLRGFYVEVYRNPLHPGLGRCHSFSSVDGLEAYIGQIRIDW